VNSALSRLVRSTHPCVSTGTTITIDCYYHSVKFCEPQFLYHTTVNHYSPVVHNFTPPQDLGQAERPLSKTLQRRVKVEFQDEDGTRYTLAAEGKLTRRKVMKIMDLMELVDSQAAEVEAPATDTTTFFGKLLEMIDASFPGIEFSSSDIAGSFEEKYNQPIPLSTVATYLARLVDRGLLKRQKFGNSWVYRRVYVSADRLSAK
jgi:hypothetical protein